MNPITPALSMPEQQLRQMLQILQGAQGSQQINPGLYFTFVPPSLFPATAGGALSQQILPGVSSQATLSVDMIPVKTFSDADADALARALHEAEDERLEDTLRTLNGFNGHTTAQWLDYYIANPKKIIQKLKVLESAPSMANESPSRPSGSPSHGSQPPKKSPRKTRAKTRQDERSRRTLSPQKHQRPRVASRYKTRSPTPPPSDTIVISPQGYNKYTPEDVAYFERFLAHTLKHDPGALDKTISAELAKRAPHHSELSWLQWMRYHANIAKKVRDEVLGSAEDNFSLSDLESRNSGDDDDQGEDDDDNAALSVSLSEIDSDSDSEVQLRNRPATRSADKRIKYLPWERQALARHIAEITLDRWDDGEQNWDRFQKKYSRHSVNGWKKWYAQHTKEIRRLAWRLENRNVKKKQELAGKRTGTKNRRTARTASSNHSY